MIEQIKALLRPLLARRLSPAERRDLAEALRTEADHQAALAEAAGRELRRPAAARVAGGKGGRPGAQDVYLRVDPRNGREDDVLKLRIGRGVYDAYQATRRDPSAPLRLLVQISGGELGDQVE